jgi:RNA polymerase sigma-70 factor (ECF subfamily)
MAPTSPARAEETADRRNWSQLMARAQDGDRQAYSELLESIVPYVRRLARRRLRNAEDVEDAVQDILLLIHAVRQTYDPGRPFGPWLLTIAKRRISDRLRQQMSRSAREVQLRPEHETLSVSPTNLGEERVDGRRLREMVEVLPPAQRAAIKLLKLREMSLKEAAGESGMSIPALKAAGHRALKALRAKLMAHED